MASSNRHWPSLFKSKHCSNHHHHHQWQHAIATSSSPSSSSLLPNSCQRPPYSSGPGCEERTPEPKPRWNPKPEQIRILEAIFNSGMVNPPRDEIRKIRAQLQEYGQVGDANVFYWFQNRKSRSKHKLRHLQASRQAATATSRGGGPAGSNNNNIINSHSGAGSSCAAAVLVAAVSQTPAAAPSNSSSSSERSTNSGASDRTAFASSVALGMGLPAPNTALLQDASNNAPATSMVGHHATYLTGGDVEPFSFLQLPQGYPLPTDDMTALVAGIPDVPYLELFSGLRAAEFVGQHPHPHHHHGCVKGSSRNMDALAPEDNNKMQQLHLHQQNGVYGTPTAAESTAVTTIAAIVTTASAASPISEIHVAASTAGKSGTGAGSSGSSGCSRVAAAAASAPRLVAFINGLVFEVAEPGLINVKEVFGDEAVLFHANGNPVLVDDWGVTMEPLQHGASYFLV